MLFFPILSRPILGGGNSNIFLCSPRTLGKVNPIWLYNNFRMGWFNHQLVYSWGIYESNLLFFTGLWKQTLILRRYVGRGLFEQPNHHIVNVISVFESFLAALLQNQTLLYCSTNIHQCHPRIVDNTIFMSVLTKLKTCIAKWFHTQLGVFSQVGIPIGDGFKYFLFSSQSLGKWWNLTSIFQMGWFNHQLVNSLKILKLYHMNCHLL